MQRYWNSRFDKHISTAVKPACAMLCIKPDEIVQLLFKVDIVKHNTCKSIPTAVIYFVCGSKYVQTLNFACMGRVSKQLLDPLLLSHSSTSGDLSKFTSVGVPSIEPSWSDGSLTSMCFSVGVETDPWGARADITGPHARGGRCCSCFPICTFVT